MAATRYSTVNRPGAFAASCNFAGAKESQVFTSKAFHAGAGATSLKCFKTCVVNQMCDPVTLLPFFGRVCVFPKKAKPKVVIVRCYIPSCLPSGTRCLICAEAGL